MADFKGIKEKTKNPGPIRANGINYGSSSGNNDKKIIKKNKDARSEILYLETPLMPHTSEKMPEKPKITIIDYNDQHYHEAEAKDVEECFRFKNQPTVTWINIDGLHQMAALEKLGACYGIHPLVLEDILTDQRPK
ncbi:MAG TPA: hypothetical protein PLZ44_09755, partial [Methanothrix sp.]|nr:hypothetical protein [Methanothrix sp.]